MAKKQFRAIEIVNIEAPDPPAPVASEEATPFSPHFRVPAETSVRVDPEILKDELLAPYAKSGEQTKSTTNSHPSEQLFDRVTLGLQRLERQRRWTAWGVLLTWLTKLFLVIAALGYVGWIISLRINWPLLWKQLERFTASGSN